MKDLSSNIDYVQTKHLIVNRDYLEIFDQIGFQSFESVWRFANGETIKKIKTRSVVRFNFSNHGIERTFYLKRHHLEFVGLSRLFSRLFPNLGLSQGRLEFQNICEFRNNKLPSVAPVASGEKFIRFFWAESFFITEDFFPFASLETIFKDQPQFFKGPEGNTRKQILLNEIGILARKMHQKGFNHLDFNATHILLHYDKGSNVPKLALFDFQRMNQRKFLRLRWKIKSLARLNDSLPDDVFDEKDRRNLFLFYQRKDELHFWDRVQWFWIKKKTAKIERHTRKILSRRDTKTRS